MIDLHGTCRHKTYLLTCARFDQLIARARGRCELCRALPTEKKLHIDHDHRFGWMAVRGLLCGRCNNRIERVDKGRELADAAVVRFMNEPFYLELPEFRVCKGPEVWRKLRALEREVHRLRRGTSAS